MNIENELLKIMGDPIAAQRHNGLALLIKHKQDEVLYIMAEVFSGKHPLGYITGFDQAPYRNLFKLMVERWDQGGESFFNNVMSRMNVYWLKEMLLGYLQFLGEKQYPALRVAIKKILTQLEPSEQLEIWMVIAKSHPHVFLDDMHEMLAGKSKPRREIAAKAIADVKKDSALPTAYAHLESKKSDARIGGALLIQHIASPSSVGILLAVLETENSDEVRLSIRNALSACGGHSVEQAYDRESLNMDSFIKKFSKNAILPKTTWLSPEKYLPIRLKDGSELQIEAFEILVSKQAKCKEIVASEDAKPLIQAIDLQSGHTFAARLLEDFLNSEQAASDRWALTLGGLLGDNRVISLLLPRIHDWCENSRHKLAEYAAQAIALLPGNEALMVLDTLANRYRNKFKNVGKACADAFNAAATARGMSADELGDIVVPDFGFDAEGIRRFDWQGGGASAELTADFKLLWFDPETDKSWKSLPANAPDDIKTEVKTLTKLLREAVKGQTARLELTLVRQRRWPVARWRELFENHPLLRSFASGLVWGIYDGKGSLLRTFRRYSNGILADAAGNIEELAETDSVIGMIHPLEFTPDALHLWCAHFARMKVKSPFPQLDRPVELMDPLHGNRKSITLTDGKKLSAGTFKSRAEKRGWTRGSVVDAGGISSYYKLYPGAGIEVVLPTDNFYVGIDPMDTIELSAACFAKAGSIERGSYIYNEPAPDDPRVLRFDQIPAVVFSETIGDLKAIIATKE